MGPRRPADHPPYADADDARTMRGDCRVTSVRIGLVDPLDRHLAPARDPHRSVVPAGADAAAAAEVAARLGL